MISYIKLVLKEYSAQKIGQKSAAFAYFSIFAIGPLLLVILGIVGLIYGSSDKNNVILGPVNDYLGNNAADTINSLLQGLQSTKSGLLAISLGVVGLILTASGLLEQAQVVFNDIFKAVKKSGQGIKLTIFLKLKNIISIVLGVIIYIGLLSATGIITSVVGKEIDFPFVISSLSIITTIVLGGVILGLGYRLLPLVVIPYKTCITSGIIITAALTIISQTLFLLVANNATAGAYGVAASVIILMLFLNYTAQLIFLGAIGIKVYSKLKNNVLLPKKYGSKQYSLDTYFSKKSVVTMIERAKQGFYNSKK